jgi:hypothetical protein
MDKMHAHITKAMEAYGAEKASGGATHLHAAKAAASAHHDKAVGIEKSNMKAMKGHMNKMAKAIGAEELDVEGEGPDDESSLGHGGEPAHKGAVTMESIENLLTKMLDERDARDAAEITKMLADTAPVAAPGVGDRSSVVKAANAPRQTVIPVTKAQDNEPIVAPAAAIVAPDVERAIKMGDTNEILKLAKLAKAGNVPLHLSGFAEHNQ